MFYHLFQCHCQSCFCLDNPEGKHRRLSYCSLAISLYIDPTTGLISAKSTLNYHHFAQIGILSRSKDDLPEDKTIWMSLNGWMDLSSATLTRSVSASKSVILLWSHMRFLQMRPYLISHLSATCSVSLSLVLQNGFIKYRYQKCFSNIPTSHKVMR